MIAFLEKMTQNMSKTYTLFSIQTKDNYIAHYYLAINDQHQKLIKELIKFGFPSGNLDYIHSILPSDTVVDQCDHACLCCSPIGDLKISTKVYVTIEHTVQHTRTSRNHRISVNPSFVSDS